jgi:hypothetical protein
MIEEGVEETIHISRINSLNDMMLAQFHTGTGGQASGDHVSNEKRAVTPIRL